ncbi:MAG TPA: ABC transporter ATP-binding protein [Candidatus Paceibacterota bacterium]|nr:ABC transporter ATP-binding protein [Verrucomicrobiota bacterium]HSA12729.1 ABC transporter ATP-binding protein [Candidatus Paceibacterota bacterium]
MSSPVISVRNLGKKYRLGATLSPDTLRDHIMHAAGRLMGRGAGRRTPEDVWALKDVSFEVKQGEVLGVIGPNGSGKSTLLKILTRITEPTEGEVHIRGRVGSLLEVGTGFHPELSGRENIYMNGAILGMTRAEINAKFDEIVDFSGVEKFLDTPVKRYSSGMRVRLGFAVAAHLEPEILLIDEVLAVGDVSFQRKCLGKMDQVARAGRTVVFVTHNMDAVIGLCSAVRVLTVGQVSERLSPEAGVRRYLSVNLAQPFAEKRPSREERTARIVRGLTVCDDQGNQNSVRVGQAIEFKLELRDFTHTNGMACSVAIRNQQNQRVALFDTRYHAGRVLEPQRIAVVSCRVPSLPLVPGAYYVDVILTDGSGVIERLEPAAQMEVVFADVFGSGRLPSSSQGHLALPCSWESDARFRSIV